MPRKDASDDEVAATENAFRLYMRQLFPRAKNLEAHLDEMDAIDAIMDREEGRTRSGKDSKILATGGGTTRHASSSKKNSPKKESSSADEEGSDEASIEGSSDYEDIEDDYNGPVQLNVIFAVGAPLEEDDSDDSDWEAQTDDDDSEMDEDTEGAIEFLEMLQNSAQHRYNTRSKAKLRAASEAEEENDQMDVDECESSKQKTATKRAKTAAREKQILSDTDELNHNSRSNTQELESADDMIGYFLEHGEDAFREKFAQQVAVRQDCVKEKIEQRRRRETRVERKKNTSRFKKALQKKNTSSNLSYFTKLDPSVQEDILARLQEVNDDMNSGKPSKIALLQTDIPVEYKVHAMRKLNSLANMDPSSGEYYKVKQWIDGFMRLPFGKRSDMPVRMGDSDQATISKFMESARTQLDGVTYGMEDAKSQIMQLVGQWVANPSSRGTAIGIKGPMGTGKTTLVKHGVSKILKRPFAFITLGGATDSSYLEGHSYTYEGSVWGQIATILMQSQSMNPVIYFDELDKVSDTAKGQEIIGILTHLTDTTQNTEFHDKYFAGINFDLSGALFIFSYNDENLVNPILRDRMHVIETKGYDAKDKRAIARQFLIPEVQKTINFNEGDILISDVILDHITSTYTSGEKGVRNLKRCLENIYAKLNVSRLAGSCATVLQSSDMIEFKTPFTVTREVVDTLLKTPTRDIPPSMYC